MSSLQIQYHHRQILPCLYVDTSPIFYIVFNGEFGLTNDLGTALFLNNSQKTKMKTTSKRLAQDTHFIQNFQRHQCDFHHCSYCILCKIIPVRRHYAFTYYFLSLSLGSSFKQVKLKNYATHFIFDAIDVTFFLTIKIIMPHQ